MPSGFLLINKPSGWTSHDVVAYLRKVSGIKTIGHAGTLDPFATGLLIVGVDRAATKRLDGFKQLPKTYVATLRLGATSDTGDRTGRITLLLYKQTPSLLPLVGGELNQILKKFIGKQTQIPPMYSAKKVQGKKLYALARQGKTIERQPQTIEIYKLDVLSYHPSPLEGEAQVGVLPLLTIQVTCSPGTYIRTLAEDIGAAIGCGAYCETLERTAIGQYSLDRALAPTELTSATWTSFLFDLSTAT